MGTAGNNWNLLSTRLNRASPSDPLRWRHLPALVSLRASTHSAHVERPSRSSFLSVNLLAFSVFRRSSAALRFARTVNSFHLLPQKKRKKKKEKETRQRPVSADLSRFDELVAIRVEARIQDGGQECTAAEPMISS